MRKRIAVTEEDLKTIDTIYEGYDELKAKAEKIMNGENVGYAYLTLLDGGPRQQFIFHMTPKNIANFIGRHFCDARQIILTDMSDQLIADTYGGFLNRCPDAALCKKIQEHLVPIQLGEREPEEFVYMTKAEWNEYNEWLDEQETINGIVME